MSIVLCTLNSRTLHPRVKNLGANVECHYSKVDGIIVTYFFKKCDIYQKQNFRVRVSSKQLSKTLKYNLKAKVGNKIYNSDLHFNM